MKITPVGLTVTDWKALDAFVTRGINLSPVRFLDSNRFEQGKIESYLISLEFYFSGGNEQVTHLENANRSLEHVFVTFAIECSDFEAEGFTDLFMRKHTYIKEFQRVYTGFILVSGSLGEWKKQVINGCKEQQSFPMREACNHVFNWFKASGLGRIFNGYSVRTLRDSSFVLE